MEKFKIRRAERRVKFRARFGVGFKSRVILHGSHNKG